MILGPDGEPINYAQLKEPQSGGSVHVPSQWELGSNATLTPARLRAIMRGQGDLSSQLKLARDIEEQDAHVFGELAKRRRRILMREWGVHAPEGASAKVTKAADFVRAYLKSLTAFEDVVYDQTEAISHVYACHEMVWGTVDGVPVPTDFEWRHQEYLKLKRVDRTPGNAMCGDRSDLRFDDGTPDGQALWPGGWLLHVHKAKSGYLDRVGLTRVLASMFMVKHHCTMNNLPRWMEVYGIPPRIGKYDPGNVDEKGKRALFNAIRYMGQDAGGIIPNTMTIDLMEAATGNAEAFLKVADAADQYASKAILGRDKVASGALGGGSGQNEANNAEMAYDLNVADCKQLARSITRDVIAPIVAYFGISDTREVPQFRFDTSEAADVKTLAEGLKAAQSVGIQIKRDWAYGRLQIPVPTPEDELLEAPAPAPSPFGMPGGNVANDPNNPPSDGNTNGQPPEPPTGGRRGQTPPARPGARDATLTALLLASLAAQRPPPRDTMDDAVDAMLDGWEPAMDDLLAPIRAAFAEAAAKGESLAALQARLPELLAEMDVTKLTDRLAHGQFLGHLAGSAGLLDRLPKR